MSGEERYSKTQTMMSDGQENASSFIYLFNTLHVEGGNFHLSNLGYSPSLVHYKYIQGENINPCVIY